jgi:hypothetical protein
MSMVYRYSRSAREAARLGMSVCYRAKADAIAPRRRSRGGAELGALVEVVGKQGALEPERWLIAL